jgi:hypothetical protein
VEITYKRETHGPAFTKYMLYWLKQLVENIESPFSNLSIITGRPDFYVAPNVAMEKLGWAGATHKLNEDLGWYFQGYKARGGETKKMDLGKVRTLDLVLKISYIFLLNQMKSFRCISTFRIGRLSLDQRVILILRPFMTNGIL